MRNWSAKTWIFGVVALLPIALGLAFDAASPTTEYLRNNEPSRAFLLCAGLTFTMVPGALLLFGGHLGLRLLQKSATVGQVVGYGCAFLAGPVLGFLAPGGTGFEFSWLVTLSAFPVYWFRVIRPDSSLPKI